MAAMARLVASGNVYESTAADDFDRQKLAVEYIHRQLQEADEANLIDEQDMHIFDSWPLTDPLLLVSCNACRKPVKASQFAIHAELCASLTPVEEIGSELGGNTGRKKPPRKERRKSLMVHSNQGTSSVCERPKFEPLDSRGISTSQSQPETPSAAAKRKTSSQATTIQNPRKRSRMMTTEGSPLTLDNSAPSSAQRSTISLESGIEVSLLSRPAKKDASELLEHAQEHAALELLEHTRDTLNLVDACSNFLL